MTDASGAHPSAGLIVPRQLTVRMRSRDVAESHRVSTPLELLFDLTFVVAVAQAAAQLAHAIAADHASSAVAPYLMVFFAIWWAWMNFTWFASAYDTDDVPYRLMTIVQMAGVLVLAAGVPTAFETRDFSIIVVGYVIMRIAMVGQWLRAARQDPDSAPAAHRYAFAITLAQIGWVVRLWLPDSLGMASFVALVLVEISIPRWAEATVKTSWHPHHVAERYGLFTIIVLGECVTAATVAIQANVGGAEGTGPDLVLVGAAAILILFGLWWLYFLKPAGEGLERNRDRSFIWGYGHYLIHASLAALGAGLEVAAESLAAHGEEHEIAASSTVVAFAVAIPIVLILMLMWLLHAPLGITRLRDAGMVCTAAAGVVVAAAFAAGGVAVPYVLLLESVPIAGLLAWILLRQHRVATVEA